MRMDQSPSSLTAAYVVNNMAEEEISCIIREYVEEKRARRIANSICLHCKEQLIKTTNLLAEIVRRCLKVPSAFSRSRRLRGPPRIDPATLTFQALCIYVNN